MSCLMSRAGGTTAAWWRGLVPAVTFAVLVAGREAQAADPFEIQVYDGTANAPGSFGLELHLNHVAEGLQTAPPPALPTDGVTHFTLEPSFGVRAWWELGAYLQTAVRPDGRFDYAGAKLRSKFVTTRAFSPTLRFGVNLEVSRIPAAYEPDLWGGEIRPIAAWETERWLLAANPIVGTPLAGHGVSVQPTFEPAVMALCKVGSLFDFGLEYYGSLGRFAGFDAPAKQEHYLYEVINLLSAAQLELNAGVGEGLTPASNRLVLKLIAGWTFPRAGHTP